MPDAAGSNALTEKVGAGGTALLRGAKTSTVSAVSETDANKAADAVTANWSVDAAKVEFATTFSGLPKEVQNSVKKNQQGKAKAVFHPESNSNMISLWFKAHAPTIPTLMKHSTIMRSKSPWH